MGAHRRLVCCRRVGTRRAGEGCVPVTWDELYTILGWLVFVTVTSAVFVWGVL